MERTLVIAYGDDWEGFYVEGNLIDENHSLPSGSYGFDEALRLLGVTVQYLDVTSYLGEAGNLPERLSGLPKQ